MKAKLQIRRGSVHLYDSVYEISDADSFGRACAQAWRRIHEQKEKETSSIGALMDVISESVLDELEGAEIRIERIR